MDACMGGVQVFNKYWRMGDGWVDGWMDGWMDE